MAARDACSVVAHFQLQEYSEDSALVTVAYYSCNYDTQFLLAHWNNTVRCWQPTSPSFRLYRGMGGLPSRLLSDSNVISGFGTGEQAGATDTDQDSMAIDSDREGREGASDTDFAAGGV